MVPREGHPKPHIPLSLGDPTVYGNFALPPTLRALAHEAIECVARVARARARPVTCPRLPLTAPPNTPPYRPTSSLKWNGYQHSTGAAEARAAVAAVYNGAGVPGLPVLGADVRIFFCLAPPALLPCSAPFCAASARAPPAAPPTPTNSTLPPPPQDVVIASGCSHALDLAITALLNPGDALLVPRPGFPLYTTLCESRGIRVLQYACDPHRDWEVDLAHLGGLLRAEGAAAAARPGAAVALLLNNPSNPCGSVWADAHLREVMALAEGARVPVIADEIYWRLPFPRLGRSPLPAAGATRAVPVLTVGGIAKEFMVPGWRLGWVCVHDRGGALREVKRGLKALSQLVMGANTVVQALLPRLLTPAAGGEEAAALAAWRGDTLARLQAHAEFTVARLRAIPGLLVVEPQGAMYCMFRVPAGAGGAHDDLAFARGLLEEENVFVLPGSAFSAPGFCRVVITPPLEKLGEAFERMAGYVARAFTAQA